MKKYMKYYASAIKKLRKDDYMKKVILSLTLLASLALTACSGNTSTPGAQQSPEPQATEQSVTEQPTEPASDQPSQSPTVDTAEIKENNTNSNMLIVYFSMPETTDPNNMTQEEENSAVVIDGQVLGNTQYVAQIIEEHTGADVFRIEPVTPYPTDHDTLVDLASDEQDQDARPAISGTINNLDDYDTIFIGYPNWWGDMPMILYTFLEQYDLSGKTIIPFNTHGGSGFSSTISAIASLEPEADVETNGFSVSRNNVHEAAADVIAWLEELGFEAVN